MTDRLKLVGYIRVSTGQQVDNGQGLEIQEESIRKWTKDSGHRLLNVYRDEGKTGTNDDREGLQEAIGAVRFNGADGLVVYSLDRLARTLTVQEGALVSIWKEGGRVFTVDSGEILADDPDDPMRTALRKIVGVISELEAGLIRVRLKKGKAKKAEGGGYIGTQVPYGYRLERKELIEDDEEQAVIALAKRLHDEGSSLRQIMAHLNDQGIPAKSGGPWHPTGVMRILK